MSHGDPSDGQSSAMAATPREQLLELRGGSDGEPDPVPPVRASKRGASSGREDIELAVAASGLRIGERVILGGEITYLSASSGGAVWMRVQLDGGRGCFDCWASEHKGKSDG